MPSFFLHSWIPERPRELQIVSWRAELMESELRLCTHISMNLPSLCPHPPGICTSSLCQFQWPHAMVTLLPTVPHPCACQVGKKLKVAPAGTVLWVCQAQLLPSASTAKAEQKEGQLECSLPAPHLFFSPAPWVGAQDVCVLHPSLQTGLNSVSPKLSKGSGKQAQMQIEAVREISFFYDIRQKKNPIERMTILWEKEILLFAGWLHFIWNLIWNLTA